MRTVFLGSPPFATSVLARLLESDHRVLALVTPPDRPRGRGRVVEPSELVRFALDHEIEVLQPKSAMEPDCMSRLRELRPDVLVVASYGVILKEELLELAPHGALNVHASLLPRHRGASPIQAALLCGDERTGVAIQRMVLALDEGDVVVSRDHVIPAEANAGQVIEALSPLGGEALVEALDAIADGSATFTPQGSEGVTYARKLRKEHGHLEFARPAPELERQVRAMNPWPGARCLDPKGRVLTVKRARCVEIASTGQPGELLEADARLVVATGAGALELVEIAAAGKREMGAAEYLRGARLAVGDRFETIASDKTVRPIVERR